MFRDKFSMLNCVSYSMNLLITALYHVNDIPQKALQHQKESVQIYFMARSLLHEDTNPGINLLNTINMWYNKWFY
jgi:hypothetical protein